MYLQLMINFSPRIRHIVPMRIKTQRRKEGHEECIGHFRIRNLNRLPFILTLAFTFIQKRAHHPVLHTVLPLQPRILRPRRPRPYGHRSLVGATAINHSDVEAARKIVHVDPERVVGVGCTEGLCNNP